MKTGWGAFNRYLRSKNNCGAGCKYYSVCPYKSEAECTLKSADISVKQTFYNLFVLGEAGIVNELKRNLTLLSGKMDTGNAKELIAYLDLLMKVHKLSYHREEEEFSVNISKVEPKKGMIVETTDPESLFVEDKDGTSPAERIIHKNRTGV